MSDANPERVVGMVLVRPAPEAGIQPFMADVAQGVESVFAPRGCSLMVRLVTEQDEEPRIWREWAKHRLVEAILMVDLWANQDPRLALIDELGVPVILLGGPGPANLTSVFVDNAAGARAAVTAFADLGHRSVARVSGPPHLSHVSARDRAFLEESKSRGLRATVLAGDFSEESGRRLTRSLMALEDRPTAVLFDNDLMAVGGIAAARAIGFETPADLAVIAWDDTANARLADPPLSVVAVDLFGLGVRLGEATLALLDGAPPRAHRLAPPTVRLAAST